MVIISERGCVSKTGWQAATDHMHSGKGHADDAYLVMSLRIGGFQGSEQVVNGKSVTLGTISFVFELDCSADCTLFFMQVNAMYCSLRGPRLIKSVTLGTILFCRLHTLLGACNIY